MKSKSISTLVGLVLYCACAAAQESSPAAAASAPYAGATISDFKGKVSIQLPAQALPLLFAAKSCRRIRP